VLSGEATNTNFIVFGLTRQGIEPTIYRTRGEHANHYTTDEPTIYRTRGEHANHYTTDEPTIYALEASTLTITPTVRLFRAMIVKGTNMWWN
jgi:hypothetical protein